LVTALQKALPDCDTVQSKRDKARNLPLVVSAPFNEEESLIVGTPPIADESRKK